MGLHFWPRLVGKNLFCVSTSGDFKDSRVMELRAYSLSHSPMVWSRLSARTPQMGFPSRDTSMWLPGFLAAWCLGSKSEHPENRKNFINFLASDIIDSAGIIYLPFDGRVNEGLKRSQDTALFYVLSMPPLFGKILHLIKTTDKQTRRNLYKSTKCVLRIKLLLFNYCT